MEQKIPLDYHSRTATLYSAALDDGDYHQKEHSLAAFLLGRITPFPEKMRINRAFGQEMYKGFKRDGYERVLDIGAGPMPRGHEWAPGMRILYTDHNPHIVEHANRKLRSDDNAIYKTASVGDVPELFESGIADSFFNGDRRLAIASNAVLMFVSDEEIRNTFRFLHSWAAPGSVAEITITGVTSSERHFRARMIQRFFKFIDAPMYVRNIDRLAELFHPWVIEKGPMPCWEWLNWPPSKNTAGVGFDIYGLRLVKK
ncbi:MAG TPA: hypothetical protein ENJ35_02870 [Gammaproteobacteria bacterium]|nr:hypothetical protein [Gammaproteobacteria bacterium]